MKYLEHLDVSPPKSDQNNTNDSDNDEYDDYDDDDDDYSYKFLVQTLFNIT